MLDIEALYRVTRCFSTGTVSAKAAKDSSGETLYVGGMVGYINKGSLSNCIAAGASVTIAGGYSSSRGIGRISGNASANLSANFAEAAMKIYNSTAYGGSPSSLSPASVKTGKDGETVTTGEVVNSFVWTDPDRLAFNNTQNGSSGMIETWDFSMLPTYGYPRLLGVEGQYEQ